MNISTGKTYNTREEALAAGVPESDIAELIGNTTEVTEYKDPIPIVRSKSGPFMKRVYRRTLSGQLIRIS